MTRYGKEESPKGLVVDNESKMSVSGKRKYPAKLKLWRQPNQVATATRQGIRAIYALGVTLGISRKKEEEPGRIGIVD